jgi:hypothetical protein
VEHLEAGFQMLLDEVMSCHTDLRHAVRHGPVQGGNGRVQPKGASETCSPREWSVPNVRSGNILPEVLWRHRIREEDEDGGASSRPRLRAQETHSCIF